MATVCVDPDVMEVDANGRLTIREGCGIRSTPTGLAADNKTMIVTGTGNEAADGTLIPDQTIDSDVTIQIDLTDWCSDALVQLSMSPLMEIDVPTTNQISFLVTGTFRADGAAFAPATRVWGMTGPDNSGSHRLRTTYPETFTLTGGSVHTVDAQVRMRNNGSRTFGLLSMTLFVQALVLPTN